MPLFLSGDAVIRCQSLQDCNALQTVLLQYVALGQSFLACIHSIRCSLHHKFSVLAACCMLCSTPVVPVLTALHQQRISSLVGCCFRQKLCWLIQAVHSGPFFADQSALEKLKGVSGFESVEWDIALSGQNPHAIGVAVKAGSDRESDEREAAFEQRANKSSRNKKKSVKAGFGKSV